MNESMALERRFIARWRMFRPALRRNAGMNTPEYARSSALVCPVQLKTYRIRRKVLFVALAYDFYRAGIEFVVGSNNI